MMPASFFKQETPFKERFFESLKETHFPEPGKEDFLKSKAVMNFLRRNPSVLLEQLERKSVLERLAYFVSDHPVFLELRRDPFVSVLGKGDVTNTSDFYTRWIFYFNLSDGGQLKVFLKKHSAEKCFDLERLLYVTEYILNLTPMDVLEYTEKASNSFDFIEDACEFLPERGAQSKDILLIQALHRLGLRTGKEVTKAITPRKESYSHFKMYQKALRIIQAETFPTPHPELPYFSSPPDISFQKDLSESAYQFALFLKEAKQFLSQREKVESVFYEIEKRFSAFLDKKEIHLEGGHVSGYVSLTENPEFHVVYPVPDTEERERLLSQSAKSALRVFLTEQLLAYQVIKDKFDIHYFRDFLSEEAATREIESGHAFLDVLPGSMCLHGKYTHLIQLLLLLLAEEMGFISKSIPHADWLKKLVDLSLWEKIKLDQQERSAWDFLLEPSSDHRGLDSAYHVQTYLLSGALDKVSPIFSKFLRVSFFKKLAHLSDVYFPDDRDRDEKTLHYLLSYKARIFSPKGPKSAAHFGRKGWKARKKAKGRILSSLQAGVFFEAAAQNPLREEKESPRDELRQSLSSR